MPLVKGAELAREAGDVSRAAITKARDRGEIHMNSDGLYDLDHPDNAAYIIKKLTQKSEREHKLKAAEAHQKLQTAQKKTVPKKKAITKKGTQKPGKKDTTGKVEPKPKNKSVNKINEKARQDGNSQAEINMKIKEVQLKTNEVKYHQLLGDVVMRDSVRPIFNKIYKAGTYFQDFGQRYAGEWAAILGVTDSAKILDLEKSIDIATEKFMEAFTETVAGSI